jgi:cell division protein FtsW
MFGFGLLMIFSSSSVSTVLRYHKTPSYFFVRQLLFIAAGTIVGLIAILPRATKRYNFIVWPAIFIVIVALGGLFIYAPITGGAQSWYNLKFFSLQPSEFAKSALIIFYACYYDRLSKKNTDNLTATLLPIIISSIIAILVMMQPDMGSAVIVMGISFLMFISVPSVSKQINKVMKIIFGALAIGVLVLLYSGNNLLNNTQMRRLIFKDPCSRYMEATGYQVCNGLIAIKNGGVFGVGLGNSTQKYLYLPESHTDFIFPIIVEELGMFTGIIVVIVYGLILFRIYKIAKNSETLRCSIIAYGTFWYLALHILINLLGILALIPLTGVPLPFLSYGGSFTVNIIIMLFFVQRACAENKMLKLKREITQI